MRPEAWHEGFERKYMNSTFKKSLIIGCAFAVAGVAQGQVMTLSALSGFSADGNGWLSPAETVAGGFTHGTDRVRGMAYNPVTGNIITVRSAGGAGTAAVTSEIRVHNGTTGASIGTFNLTGIAGGAIALNNIAISQDGQIFVTNLSTNTVGSPFRIYRFDSETAGLASTAATVVFAGSPNAITNARLGDSFDAIGSGSSVSLVAGYGTNTVNGFARFDQSGPTSFGSTYYSVAGTANGDFRLGLSFIDRDTVLGTQGVGTFSGASRVRYSTVSGSSASLLATMTMLAGSERLIDVMQMDGRTLMATADSNNNDVRVWDITNPSAPTALFINGSSSFINLTSAAAANVNGVGAVRWGNFTGVASGGYEGTLYVLNANNGVQAFKVQLVPEPATMTALGLGVAAMLRKRRKSK